MIPFLIIICLILLIFIVMYNSLIRKKNSIDNTLGSMDAMLKKRYDLIPNLVETVKQYMKYEEKVQVEITELRSKAVSPETSNDQRVEIDNKLSKIMSGMMVSVENYPDLKANQNFLNLEASWNEIEEQISAARRTFNAVVTDYNNGVEMFPSNIIAYLMGLKPRKVFEIPETERQNISAKELFNS